jgi:hypothetical protein
MVALIDRLFLLLLEELIGLPHLTSEDRHGHLEYCKAARRIENGVAASFSLIHP